MSNEIVAVPPIPETLKHNTREWYEGAEYLEWYNGLTMAGRGMNNPAVIEMRIESALKAGNQVDKFGYVTKRNPDRADKPRSKEQRMQRLLRTQQDMLEKFRSLASFGDLEQVYDVMLEQALDGKVAALKLYLQYVIGEPPKQVMTAQFNVNDAMERLMGHMEGQDVDEIAREARAYVEGAVNRAGD